MNQDEFETLISSLASQYADACNEEIEALKAEMTAQRLFAAAETAALSVAYGSGQITGKNAELRKIQCNEALIASGLYNTRLSQHELAILDRKAATAVRVGVEHEWKLWRAWLASQQGGSE